MGRQYARRPPRPGPLYFRPMLSRSASWAALGLLSIYLLVGLAVGLRNTALRLRAAARTAGLSAGEMRALVFGREFASAVAAIRSAIPEGEPYLLREVGEPGAALWVRFDLLPRRAILQTADLAGGRRRDCLLPQVRWLVVATGAHRPPLLLGRSARVPPGCAPAPWMRPLRAAR
jgi:hypothetical protein